MEKKKKRKKGAAAGGGVAAPGERSAATGVEVCRGRRRKIWRDFLVGLGLTAVLVLGKMWVEHGRFGRQFEQMTVNLLQLRLSEAARERALPVTVVDISGLVPVRVESAGKVELVTPRRELLEIVDAVAVQNPAAIGIDVIFEPDAEGKMTEEETQLLDFCVALGNKEGGRVPVFVAVFDSVVLGPKRWLGEERFGSLAAYILVPRPKEHEAAGKMIYGITVTAEGVEAECDSMAYALAQAGRREETERRWLGRMLHEKFGGLVEQAETRRGDVFKAREFAVDYGALGGLMNTAIAATKAEDLAGKKESFAGKVVLIGRGKQGQTMDQFNVPGEAMPVPGVYVHAAAAYTLLEAPLYRLTHAGRVAADVLAALVPLGFILGVRLWVSGQTKSELDAHRISRWLMIATAAGIFVFGYFWVDWSGILWTDYLMVVGALLLHSPAERLVTGVWGVGRRMGKQGLRGAIFEDEHHGDGAGR